MFFLLLFMLAVALFIYSWIQKRPWNYPPGPPCLPLVGTSPFLSGNNLQFTMEQWRVKYGPLVGLVLGSRHAVAVVESSAVLEVLRNDDFQGRPDSAVTRSRTFDERLGVFFTDGPYWVEQRRFTLRHLKEFGFGKRSMEGLILEEVEELLMELKNTKEKPIQVRNLFTVSVVNVLWSVMSGKRYERDDADFHRLLDKLQFRFRVSNPTTSSLSAIFQRLNFFSSTSRVLQQNRDDLYEFMRNVIREHEKSIDLNHPRDFIDVYLREMEQAGPGSTFTEKGLISTCLDLFSAGAESVSSTLGFCLLYMVLHPQVQRRVHEELDTVVGRDRKPSLDDRTNLMYVEATLLEVQRSNTISPLAVPHRAIKNTKLRGYDIPKDTSLFISLWCCLQDKTHWGDPEVFRPDRFIDKEGKLIRDEFMINFGLGKRVCLAESLARNELFLFFTTLMQALSFSVPLGEELPSTVPLSGLTATHQPFQIVAKQRE